MPPQAPLRLGTLVSLGMSIGLALTISACGEPAESALSATTFPSDVTTPRRSSNLETAQRVSTTFPLLNGRFQFTVRDNGNVVGTIAGRYTGEASHPSSGKPTAVLNLSIRRSTGVVSNVTLLTAADGTGAFTGEGEFTLALTVQVPTHNGPIPFKVKGTASISCSPQEQIVVTLDGTGSTPKLGDLEIELEHEVGNTGCDR